MIDEARRALAVEALEFLADLSKSGDLERHGLPSSLERFDRLIWTVAGEATSILRAELDTLTVEQRGKTGIKKVMTMVERARDLGHLTTTTQPRAWTTSGREE